MLPAKTNEIVSKENYRLALFLPNLGMGGAERVFLTLAHYFAEKGYAVDLVVKEKEGPLLEQLSESYNLINLNSKTIIGTCIAISGYLRTNKPYAIFSTLDLLSIMAIWSAWFSRTKTKVVVREASTPSKFPRKSIIKFFEPFIIHHSFKRAHVVITVSNGVLEDLHSYAKIPREKMKTIYNPVIADFDFPLQKTPINHEWFKFDSTPIIISVGSLTKLKNHSALITAFSKIASQTNARLVIFGEGEERKSLQSMINTFGLENRISLPGITNNPFPYLNKAVVFALTSTIEGLPNVLIQALSCGCHVISFDCPNGPREILDNGKYGKLITIGDIDALAKGILDLLSSPKKDIPIEWLRQFTTDVVINQYLNAVEL